MRLCYCEDKCCTVFIKPYTLHKHKRRVINKKAGVFIYDPVQKKVLVIQSKGNLWGLPKGTFEKNENSVECAIRETYEETGIQLSHHHLGKCFCIRDQATYYFVESSMQNVEIQNTIDNDVNGIGWINVDCLQKLIQNGKVKINYHAKLCFNFFLGKNLTYKK
tara:strand:- start:119 stop:607 length:489 start_codon:yes stop_codon:yes gene_type:complete